MMNGLLGNLGIMQAKVSASKVQGIGVWHVHALSSRPLFWGGL